MIALAAVLAGEVNSRGRRLRIAMAVGCVVAVRAAGLGLVGLSAKIPALISLLYLNEFLTMAVCLYALVHGRCWSHRPGSMAPGSLGPL